MKSLTIEEIVKKQIKDMDLSRMVREVVSSLVSDNIRREIPKITNSLIEKMIQAEIEIILSKGVETDNGWGEKKSYKSFDEFFKIAMKAAVQNSYEIKRELERFMKEKADAIVKTQTRELTDAMLKALETPKK